MFKLTLQNLRARKRRFVGTFLAIVLGVAFLSGTLVLGDTLTANFDRLFADANAGTDVVVRSSLDIRSEDLQSGRGMIDAGLVARVAAVPGVAAAEPQITGYGQLIGRDGKAIGGNGPPTVAGNWIANPELNAYRLAEGRAPVAGDEVVINRGAAETGGFSIGDVVTVRTPDPVRATIVGLSTFGGEDGFGSVTFTAFTFEAAQRYLTAGDGLRGPNAVDGQVSAVLVEAQDGVTQDELAARVQAALPADGSLEAITGAELTRENVDDLAADFLSFFKTFLLVFSGIALLVATFSIYNTFSILVAQRTRESALLRALGASRRQVLGSVLAETSVVGVVASLVGVACGLAIAGLLKGLFDAFGFALPAGGLTVRTGAVVLAVLIGVAATVVSGLLPAVRASRTAPVAALRDSAVDRSGTSAVRAVVGAVVAAAGVGVVVLALVGGGDSSLGVAGLGALLTLVGVVVVGPVVARPVAGAVGLPLARLRGVTGVMARRNA
ncbi:MAG: ABC transporter permease, partial [Acidimicrobiales bacterium]